PIVGQTSSTTYTQTATARKVSEDQTVTKEAWENKPATQNYQRSVPPVTQPRGQRHGNSFIPPKPVDPKSSVSTDHGDLFGDVQQPEMAAPLPPEKPVKKSPSLFERFSLRKEEPVVTPAKAETSAKMTVETGGKTDEDELDIPAFLRRQ